MKVKIILNGEIRSCCSSFPPDLVREIVQDWLKDKAEVEVVDKNQGTWQPEALASLAEKYFGESIYPLVYLDDRLVYIGDIPDTNTMLEMVEGRVAFGLTEKDIEEEARRQGKLK